MVETPQWLQIFISLLVAGLGIVMSDVVGWVMIIGGVTGVVVSVTPARTWGIYRVNESWRLLSKPPDLTQLKHEVTVRWGEVEHRSRPYDPISTLWIWGFEVANPTDIPVVVEVTGNWFINNVTTTIKESQGRGEIRVDGHDVEKISEMRFELPARERRQRGFNFSVIKKSHRYIRVTDCISGKVVQNIDVDDGTRWKRRRFLGRNKHRLGLTPPSTLEPRRSSKRDS